MNILTTAAAAASNVKQGLLGTATDLNSEIFDLIVTVGGTVVAIVFLLKAWKSGFAAGAIVSALVIGGGVLWALSGGLEWLGVSIGQDLQA